MMTEAQVRFEDLYVLIAAGRPGQSQEALTPSLIYVAGLTILKMAAELGIPPAQILRRREDWRELTDFIWTQLTSAEQLLVDVQAGVEGLATPSIDMTVRRRG